MLFHVRQDVRVGVGDEEAMSEDVDYCSDAEVLRTVKLRLFRRAARLGNAGLLQEFAADHSGVLDLRFEDGDHVVRQPIGNDESATFVEWIRRVLQRAYKQACEIPSVQYHYTLSQMITIGGGAGGGGRGDSCPRTCRQGANGIKCPPPHFEDLVE